MEDELEIVLKEVQEEWSSQSTLGIIINPKTGEIYAMAGVPTFDPNSFGNIDDVSVYSNKIIVFYL